MEEVKTFFDTTAGKVVIAVLIQVLTATLAATASSFVVLNILEYRVTRLESEIDKVSKETKERIESHWRYFHNRDKR